MYLAATAASPGNPAVAQFVISTASALTVGALLYIARMMRKLMKEHEWLMTVTKENTEAIRKMLEPRQRRG